MSGKIIVDGKIVTKPAGSNLRTSQNTTDPNSSNNERTTTSAGYSSATQQIWPGNNNGSQPNSNQRVYNQAQVQPQNNDMMANLQRDIVVFGYRMKLYYLLIAAAVAFYFYGASGLVGVGLLYYFGTTFGQPAQPGDIENNNNPNSNSNATSGGNANNNNSRGGGRQLGGIRSVSSLRSDGL